MSNMIKLGVFNIQEALYNNTNIISQKFCKNNVCVFGFKSKKLLIVMELSTRMLWVYP